MKFKKPKFWDQKKISLLSILLLPLSMIYTIIISIIKMFNIHKKFSLPVICVGNIYIGGTGKTPLVKEIFHIIKSLNKKPALIKKYYDYLIDETKMLEKIGKVYTCKNRTEGIISALKDENDVVILDDGFQDFSIKPNFSIICFNSKQLIGNGLVIPAGPLRESLNGISRADCIIINGNKNTEFENKLKIYMNKKEIPIFYSKYTIQNKAKFENKEITAFAGIGNPSNFFDLLRENSLNLKNTFSFPDHHNYTQKDFDKITKDQSPIIVTTEKDYYRMTDEQKKSCDFVKVNLDIENKNNLTSLIKEYL